RAELRVHLNGAVCSALLRFEELGHVDPLRGHLCFAEAEGFERLGVVARAAVVGSYALLEEIDEFLPACFVAEALASEGQERVVSLDCGGGEPLLRLGNVGLDELERRGARFTVAEGAEEEAEGFARVDRRIEQHGESSIEQFAVVEGAERTEQGLAFAG